MPFKATAIANLVLDLAEPDGVPVSPMKLQKLVYIAHGWHLGFGYGPLVSEAVQAWRYGPVIPAVYAAFASFGSKPITNRRADDFKLHDGKLTISRVQLPDTPEAGLANRVVLEVWNAYKQFSAVELSNATHKPGTPWDEIKQNFPLGSIPYGEVIPNDRIEDYYKKLATVGGALVDS